MKKGKLIKTIYIAGICLFGSMLLCTTSFADEEMQTPTDKEIADLLEVPQLRAVSKPNGKIVLKWNQVEGADGYTLYRAKSGSEKYSVIDSGGLDTKYTDEDASAGKEYSYRIAPEYGKEIGQAGEPVAAECFKFKIPTPYAAMYKNKSVTPKITFKGVGSIKFTSKNKKIATVNKSGKISGKKLGKTIVTASYRDISIDIEVLVADKAIDVAHWEGRINWSKVKKDGVKVAIMKCTQGISYKDPTFEYNYKNAGKNGLKVGIYSYTSGTTVKRAKQEARYILKVLNGRKLNYPIVMDFEEGRVFNSTTKEVRTKMVFAFKKIIEDAGYDFALYTSSGFLYKYFNYEKFGDVYLWVARYNGGKTYCEYTGPGKIMMWQWGGARVNGIPVSTDMNYIYPGVYK